MQATSTGSVRVDLLGGTLDLWPINLVLPKAITLNLATSLQAKVEINETSENTVVIESLDYKKTYTFQKSEFTKENIFQSNHFAEMTFITQLLDFFDIRTNVKLTLQSGSPAGAGLGGSSAMGVTVFKALCDYTSRDFDPHNTVEIIQKIEARILDSGPTGYQDYYPACFGGVLALIPGVERVAVQQLYATDLKEFLEEHITLVYSGQSRNSGVNNWAVYKSFFDKESEVREGLAHIARLSWQAYQAIQNKKFDTLLQLIGEEGQAREKLFPSIVTDEIRQFLEALNQREPVFHLKMCGAGGGGCFIVTHPPGKRGLVEKTALLSGMTVLDFQILPPMGQ